MAKPFSSVTGKDKPLAISRATAIGSMSREMAGLGNVFAIAADPRIEIEAAPV
jgi:hypothetical protein